MPNPVPSVPVTSTAKSAVDPRLRLGPFFVLVCGLLLMLGGALLYWLEPGSAPLVAAESVSQEAAASRAVDRARKREAQERAEFERKTAEEAGERARRVALLADAAAEAEARRQREEMGRRQAEAQAARSAAAESEQAWNRFYRPSERCRSPEGATSVECVNEYVKARREFASRRVAP